MHACIVFVVVIRILIAHVYTLSHTPDIAEQTNKCENTLQFFFLYSYNQSLVQNNIHIFFNSSASQN